MNGLYRPATYKYKLCPMVFKRIVVLMYYPTTTTLYPPKTDYLNLAPSIPPLININFAAIPKSAKKHGRAPVWIYFLKSNTASIILYQ